MDTGLTLEARLEKAELFFDSTSIPYAEKEKHLPVYQALIREHSLNMYIEQLFEGIITMKTPEEIKEGEERRKRGIVCWISDMEGREIDRYGNRIETIGTKRKKNNGDTG